jgi:hypothetical protein
VQVQAPLRQRDTGLYDGSLSDVLALELFSILTLET